MRIGSRHLTIRRTRVVRLRRPRPGVAIAAASAALAILAAMAFPAGAAVKDGASTVGTLVMGVRSVTVSPSSFGFTCTFPGTVDPQLNFPNGQCTSSPSVMVTNGGAIDAIDASVSSFRPSDGGAPWKPCAPFTPTTTCTGAAETNAWGSVDAPGRNQFLLGPSSARGAPANQAWTLTPTCFIGFPQEDGRCDPNYPNQGEAVPLALEGPQTTGDNSPNWSVTITFTAVPLTSRS